MILAALAVKQLEVNILSPPKRNVNECVEGGSEKAVEGQDRNLLPCLNVSCDNGNQGRGVERVVSEGQYPLQVEFARINRTCRMRALLNRERNIQF